MENGEGVESTHGRLLLPRNGTRRINAPANPSRPTFDRSTAAMVDAMDCRNWMENGEGVESTHGRLPLPPWNPPKPIDHGSTLPLFFIARVAATLSCSLKAASRSPVRQPHAGCNRLRSDGG